MYWLGANVHCSSRDPLTWIHGHSHQSAIMFFRHERRVKDILRQHIPCSISRMITRVMFRCHRKLSCDGGCWFSMLAFLDNWEQSLVTKVYRNVKKIVKLSNVLYIGTVKMSAFFTTALQRKISLLKYYVHNIYIYIYIYIYKHFSTSEAQNDKGMDLILYDL